MVDRTAAERMRRMRERQRTMGEVRDGEAAVAADAAARAEKVEGALGVDAALDRKARKCARILTEAALRSEVELVEKAFRDGKASDDTRVWVRALAGRVWDRVKASRAEDGA